MCQLDSLPDLNFLLLDLRNFSYQILSHFLFHKNFFTCTNLREILSSDFFPFLPVKNVQTFALKCRDRTEEKHYETQALYNFFHFFLLRKRSLDPRETSNGKLKISLAILPVLSHRARAFVSSTISHLLHAVTVFTLSRDENELIRAVM